MNENLDNFLINVRAREKETFALALRIAFSRFHKASHWSQNKEYGLILYWYEEKESTPFPIPLDVETAIEFCWNWYSNVDRKQFTLSSMDVYHADGDAIMKPAFRIFCEDWGHVNHSHYGICAILPVWAWLGK